MHLLARSVALAIALIFLAPGSGIADEPDSERLGVSVDEFAYALGRAEIPAFFEESPLASGEMRWIADSDNSLIEAKGHEQDVTEISVLHVFEEGNESNTKFIDATLAIFELTLAKDNLPSVWRWFSEQMKKSADLPNGEKVEATFKVQGRVLKYSYSETHGFGLGLVSVSPE